MDLIKENNLVNVFNNIDKIIKNDENIKNNITNENIINNISNDNSIVQSQNETVSNNKNNLNEMILKQMYILLNKNINELISKINETQQILLDIQLTNKKILKLLNEMIIIF